MKIRTLGQVSLLVLAGFFSASLPVFAADKVAAKASAAAVKEDVTSIFCPALADDKTYDGKYDSYRKLLAGKDGWVFRSINDLQTHLSINDAAIKMIADWQAKLKEKGIEFVMVYVPTRGMVHSNEIQDLDKETYNHRLKLYFINRSNEKSNGLRQRGGCLHCMTRAAEVIMGSNSIS